jgi:hypothetical protein
MTLRGIESCLKNDPFCDGFKGFYDEENKNGFWVSLYAFSV